MQQMQQMQVTVPDGVGPGMPFIVSTPAGPMQVICPVNATAGGAMVVNVPVQAVVVQAVPMAAEVEVVPQGVVVQAVAPQSSTMSRGQMDGRVEEIQSGCYTLSDCVCCYWVYYKVDARAGTVNMGTCCCIPLGCCPGCCMYEERKKAVAPGASDFKAVKQDGSGEDVVWETATRLRKYHPSYDPPEGTRMHKQCC